MTLRLEFFSLDRVSDLCQHVLFNYEWLHAKISAAPIDQVVEDFELALRVIASWATDYDPNNNSLSDFTDCDSHELLRQVCVRF